MTFEGGEGAGKSTQIRRLAARLSGSGYDVATTREPGGSPGAEAIRHILLSGAAEPFGPAMEAILFAAARSDHVEQFIRPAVEGGKIVLCDRFLDSSRVYQGAEGNLDPAFMASLRDVPALARALEVLSRDPDRRRSMGEAGRKRVAERFTQQALAERHIELYELIRVSCTSSA